MLATKPGRFMPYSALCINLEKTSIHVEYIIIDEVTVESLILFR